jgi:Na+/H+-translocating membrane pyrophosphatase
MLCFSVFSLALCLGIWIRNSHQNECKNNSGCFCIKIFLPQALKVSFGGGTVMGLGVAGLAVLGLTGFFIFFFFHEWGLTNSEDMTIVWRL